MRCPDVAVGKTSARALRVCVYAIVAALVATLGLAGGVPSAQAAGYSLTAAGAGTTTTDKAKTLTVTYKSGSKKVAKATVQLQYWNGKKWVLEKNVAVKNGTGSVAVKHTAMNRTYRFYVKGKAASKSFVVRFIPATFTIAGSGSGHGVGMSQYGAYELSREGKTAAGILSTYYPGTTTSTANNPSGNIRVQVLGPPADTQTTTVLTVDKGGFTLSDQSGNALFTSTAPGNVAIGVSGASVTAKATPLGGATTTLPATSHLIMAWDNTQGTVSVAGAQGTYRFGTLDVSSIQNRPNVVNQLVLNTEYLEGIDEMAASWGNAGGMAALQAQVIATRTYALRAVVADRAAYPSTGVKPSCDCNVYDDTRSQNFTGWKKTGLAANKPWVDAVVATVHEVPVSASFPSGSSVDVLRDASQGFAETPYFASTGKVTNAGTSSNTNVFGTAALPYLKGVTDPYSAKAPGNPYLSWSKKLTQAQVKKLFGEDVAKLAVSATYPGGLVKTITVTSSVGKAKTVTKTADAWRSALGVPAPWLTGIVGK